MGYYTRYAIEADKEPPAIPNPELMICCCGDLCSTPYCPRCGSKIAGFEELDTWEAIIAQRVGYGYLFEEPVKWYEHRKDMVKLSTEFPGVRFTLSGEGEEAGDVWKEYYLGGKYQEAKGVITIPEFNEDNLKEPTSKD